ncbi:hypothetical protein [Altererythrobacter sp. ZODW24]|uniref:hypothetical protein n=1 Tax=Altererythrobacter sp. ZODW24 TaxID=2185142 RepID=UPI000DF75E8B|nr:hypothetical protein [Altererythrobacter sp. ZODW24]
MIALRNGLAVIGLLSLAACSEATEQGAEASAETARAPDQVEKPVDVAEPIADKPALAKTTYGTGLCEKDEGVVFSCTMEDGKTASICAKTYSDGTEFAQYRYGQRDKALELVWPITVADGALKFATVPYSGGGEGQIAFERGEYQYVAFSRMVRTNFAPGEPNNPAITDGVMILRNGQISQTKTCDGPDLMPVQYELAEKLMGRADELFTYETQRTDP